MPDKPSDQADGKITCLYPLNRPSREYPMAHSMEGSEYAAMKRMAFAIMPLLPEDKAEALAVLAIARYLVEWNHLAGDQVLPFEPQQQR